MTEALTIPDPARAFALEFSSRLTAILAGLVLVIHHGFQRHPIFSALLVFLCTRISRARQRIERLAARIHAGRPARPNAPRPGPRHRPAGAPPRQYLPAQWGWLVDHLGDHRHHANFRRLQIEMLLAEPGAAEFLASVPRVAAILRPIFRLLALPLLQLPRRQRKPKPAAPKPAPAPTTRPVRPTQRRALPRLVAPGPQPHPARPPRRKNSA